MRGPTEVILNPVAYEKAQRRRANRKLKQQGIEVLVKQAHHGIRSSAEHDLHKLNMQARADMELRCRLADMADDGVLGAAKAKRKLNNNWTERRTQSLGGFWRDKA